jgi:hypothetical protein
MKARTPLRFGIAIGLTGLCGCVSSENWVRADGALPSPVDVAQCHMAADAANPDPGVTPVRTGKARADALADVGLVVLDAWAQSNALNGTYNLCMQSRGYAIAPAMTPSIAATPSSVAIAALPMPPFAAPTRLVPSPVPMSVAPPMPQYPPAPPCGCTYQHVSVPID